MHTLGNLTLPGDNARLSNHPFERKQQILESSALRMNLEIASAQRWGKAQILARADRLADRAVELRPSFPVTVFAKHGDEICEVLDWFVGVTALDLARTD